MPPAGSIVDSLVVGLSVPCDRERHLACFLLLAVFVVFQYLVSPASVGFRGVCVSLPDVTPRRDWGFFCEMVPRGACFLHVSFGMDWLR